MENVLEIGDLAQAIRARRAELGLTQAQLAERAHVSRKWISDVERGKEGLRLKPLLHLCRVLGLPLTMPGAVEPEIDDAELNRRIRARARRTSFGGKLAQLGITTVALDDDGTLTRYHPDGTRTAVA